MTEIDMLRTFSLRVESALKTLNEQGSSQAKLKSLYENLTFIGDKEYEEAVSSIATYWKYILDRDPKLQLLVHTGISDEDTVKSDAYMFDRVLGHFTDDELKKYNSRLITDEERIINADPEHTKVVLLDDWTISGTQLQNAASSLVARNPQLEKCIEVQLIAASKERIALGLEKVSYMSDGINIENLPIPIRAYYMAHDAPLVREENARGTHITGAHSSVDYGFDHLIQDVGNDLHRDLRYTGDRLENLPLTHIIRAYRQEGFTLNNVKRLIASMRSDPEAQKEVGDE